MVDSKNRKKKALIADSESDEEDSKNRKKDTLYADSESDEDEKVLS